MSKVEARVPRRYRLGVLAVLVAGFLVLGAALVLATVLVLAALEGPTLEDRAWAWEVPELRASPAAEVDGEAVVVAEPLEIVASAVPRSALPVDVTWAVDLEPGAIPGEPAVEVPVQDSGEPSNASVEVPVVADVPLVMPENGQEPAPLAEAFGDPFAEPEGTALLRDRGVVRLLSRPAGATVAVDGRFRGRTPVKLMLNPGTYELRLQLGGATTTLPVQVSASAVGEQGRCFVPDAGALRSVDCASFGR